MAKITFITPNKYEVISGAINIVLGSALGIGGALLASSLGAGLVVTAIATVVASKVITFKAYPVVDATYVRVEDVKEVADNG